MTVLPKLYRAFASPCNSSSRSPCNPEGGGDSDDRGESAFTSNDMDVQALLVAITKTSNHVYRVRVRTEKERKKEACPARVAVAGQENI